LRSRCSLISGRYDIHCSKQLPIAKFNWQNWERAFRAALSAGRARLALNVYRRGKAATAPEVGGLFFFSLEGVQGFAGHPTLALEAGQMSRI